MAAIGSVLWGGVPPMRSLPNVHAIGWEMLHPGRGLYLPSFF